MRKEHLATKSVHTNTSSDSGREFLKEKPKFIVKNRNTIVIFRNKILQIEPDEVKENEGSSLGKEPLFMKIIKSGQSPTDFVLKKKSP